MNKVAQEYGEALFSLCKEESIEIQVYEEEQVIKHALQQNEEYMKLLTSPKIPFEEKAKLVEKAFVNAHSYLMNLIQMMIQRGYAEYLIEALDAYAFFYREDKGMIKAIVESAIPLLDTQKEELKARLEKKYNKTIILKSKVNPSLLGGLRVTIDGKEYDGTLRHRFNEIQKKLDEETL